LGGGGGGAWTARYRLQGVRVAHDPVPAQHPCWGRYGSALAGSGRGVHHGKPHTRRAAPGANADYWWGLARSGMSNDGLLLLLPPLDVFGRFWHVDSICRCEVACPCYRTIAHPCVLARRTGVDGQVGGLVGGVKLSSSAATLPLKVEVKELQLRPEFLQKLTSHLVVIYTGKTRLARNLLQNVVRNWYARSPAIIANADNLTATAATCAEVIAGPFPTVHQPCSPPPPPRHVRHSPIHDRYPLT